MVNQEHSASLRSEVTEIFVREAAAIDQFSRVGGVDQVCDAVSLIHGRSGSITVSGIGKSGHIGRKIAATFRSLGRRAVFMHAAEGSHGDLGLIDHEGVVLILSNSGETAELADLIAYCLKFEIPMIAVTRSRLSTLGKAATICVDYGELDEVCINGLAPTTSTTLQLAIGDALAVGLSKLAGITADDFRRYHPGGELGAHLRTVGEVMRTGHDLPFVDAAMPLLDVTLTIAEKALGCALVRDGERFLGIITDGDIRRNAARINDFAARDVANADPVTVDEEQTLDRAAEHLVAHKVSVGLVTDEDAQPIGLVHIHQCVR
ncbi:KpsF/GutQ family sugar-phosphate isomerase [Sphingomicrobium aestuariivivum]|uniref:KpsF/GutQ family sugar-phosphate isomerase n=1 Tax=Sphingomicrobium aestuariivivum TaxID=1582356 RepID=UPI001FD71C44|nr:KpsF/GutQ family sugar-phosphate isomerase [Sphingomicrobium aestuariivivum]MCJ8191578.1 KpsF/GutQ family sugar-phosphate isomerase [Sphingomicrobium aestuariivivum]